MYIIRLTHITHDYVCILHMYISLWPHSFDVKVPFVMSVAYNMAHFELIAYNCMWSVSNFFIDALYSVVKWIFIKVCVIYDVHIIHYYLNAKWSVTLGQSYIVHQAYLVIFCWIWATLLCPMNITAAGALNVWRYV